MLISRSISLMSIKYIIIVVLLFSLSVMSWLGRPSVYTGIASAAVEFS